MPQPSFAHPVFEQLYTRDYFLDDAVLREIVALGPALAVPELLKIIDTALADYQAGELADTHWLDTYYFYHALYLLHELRAPEALDVYRRLLRLDADATDFWFGDNLFEEVPGLLAHAGHSRLPELLALLEDPQLLLMHRLAVSGAVAQLAREQPEARPPISAFLQQHLRRISAHPDQAPRLFPKDAGAYGYELDGYLGGVLADVRDAGLHELEPEMRELHRLGLVDETIAGGADDIDFAEGARQPLRPVPGILARYQALRADPDNDSPYHPDAAAIARRRVAQAAKDAEYRRALAAQQPRQVAPKTGRNDPCPCGSGKKYKKCHGA